SIEASNIRGPAHAGADRAPARRERTALLSNTGGRIKDFLSAGHIGTLLTALFYFDMCFAIWVLNGSMAPFISEEFHLSPSQKGLMVSVPVIAGSLMRFPLGILSQYI